MNIRFIGSGAGKSAIIWWMVAMLLFAQGVRLCMHVHHEPPLTNDHHHGSMVHLENTLSKMMDHEESAFDVDVPFPALLKAFAWTLVFALVSLFGLLIPVSRVLKHRPPPATIWLLSAAADNFTPPPRASPR